MILSWPNSADGFLVWSHTIAFWAVPTYLLLSDPPEEVGLTILDWTKTLAVSVIVIVAPLVLLSMPYSAEIVFLNVVTLFAMGFVRLSKNVRRLLPWSEFLAPSCYAVLSALVLGDHAIMKTVWIELPVSKYRIAAILFAMSLVVWLIYGGTQIVRGVLSNNGVLPKTASSGPVDEAEYSRGRVIGNFERMLLAGLLAVGSYQALGFLIAAKGLIRSQDLQDRNKAEYFLIGTLTSTAVALVVGQALQIIRHHLWH